MPSHRRARMRKSAPHPAPAETGAESLVVALGLALALVLPFAVFSTTSDAAHRELKLFAQALAAAVALLGLALVRTEPRSDSNKAPLPLRVAGGALAVAALFAVASAAVNHAVVDPLVVVAFLSPAALFLAGTSELAARQGPRLLAALGLFAALSAAAAFGERFLGLARLPIEVPEERFLATALVGNAGELAAALVLPALVLWCLALREGISARRRVLPAAGFLACALGLGAAATVTPIVALGAGLAVHALLAPRKRLLPLVAVALLGTAVLAGTGAGRRMLYKVELFRTGRIGMALTQRDIGLGAGAEMIVRSPWLGFGPGGFEGAFVPARLAAERVMRRRLVHLSTSAHFENAHCEPVTMAAEGGLPAAVLGLVSFLALLLAAVRPKGPGRDLLVPPLAAFLVLSSGTFPLRMAATAGVFAFLAGLAWRSGGGVPLLPPSPRARRGTLAAFAIVLVALASVRFLSVLWQSRGEAALREAGATRKEKADLLAQARTDLGGALRLRPRSAGALLALGSCDRLDGDFMRAWERTARSFVLQERAETDFDLGLVASARGDRAAAHELFVRAVWLFPRLLEVLGEEHDPGSVELDVAEAERRVTQGGEPPPLPASVASLLPPRRRFP